MLVTGCWMLRNSMPSIPIQHHSDLASSIEAPLVKTLHPIDEDFEPHFAGRRSPRAPLSAKWLATIEATEQSPTVPDDCHGRALGPNRSIFRRSRPQSVPGDRVAIAVDEHVPCVAGVVRGAVDASASAGIEAECDFHRDDRRAN